ncbi:MAG: DUF2293 domain-containing protein [Planctomycetes bacterium]|nr:DUF2293 domain-containing protein [Planctomycetota bacterium]
MPDRIRDVMPGFSPGSVWTAQGPLRVPEGWELLPPGDPALTRRVKSDGPHWVMSEKKGRKVFGRGVWAPAERIARLAAELASERSDPAYARRLQAGKERREREQGAYVGEFHESVLAFLRFAPVHAALAERLAVAVTTHATPVGSGTVARTERIPVQERAAAAVIAWLRHATTSYDSLTIARVRGRRREMRRELAEQSRRLLDRYREGVAVDPAACPLARALRADGEADSPA